MSSMPGPPLAAFAKTGRADALGGGALGEALGRAQIGAFSVGQVPPRKGFQRLKPWSVSPTCDQFSLGSHSRAKYLAYSRCSIKSAESVD